MEVLLDTHVLLWALTDPARLSKRLRTIIETPHTALWTSAASAWEVATKNRLGKLPQADVILAGFDRHLDRLGCRQLPVSVRHALLAGALDWDRRDPFDRMLAAQSMIESLPLATSDAAFSGLPGLEIVW